MHFGFQATDTWPLLFIMSGATALAIYLEQRYTWASKISGAVITLVLALVLVNIHLIPTHAPLFDVVVWDYAVPLAIPLLLLQANIKKIWKETGRLLLIFLIGSVGTVLGAFLASFIFCTHIPMVAPIAGMMTGSYIGGGINFVALSAAFHTDTSLVSSTVVADNLNMAFYFLVLLSCASSRFLQKHFAHPHIEAALVMDMTKEAKTQAAAYWGRKDISLKDISLDLLYAVAVVTISKVISGGVSYLISDTTPFLSFLHTFFSSEYVWITILSMLFATYGEKQVAVLRGAQEIGTYFIYLFFFVIGVPASINAIFQNAPFLFVFCFLIVVVNMLVCFVLGKIFHFTLEEIILASNANIGGPTTAAGMAIAQGWIHLIGPSLLVGTLGYVIGTYLGIFVGTVLGA